MSVRIKDTDKGFSQFKKNFEKLGAVYAEAGVLSGSGRYPDGTGVAQNAAVQEYGSGKIPSRPFMRTSFDRNRLKYEGALKVIATKSTFGPAEVVDKMKDLGAAAAIDMQRTIRDKEFQKNAPSTIARKGFDYPLVETGLLVSSIKSRVIKRRSKSKK